ALHLTENTLVGNQGQKRVGRPYIFRGNARCVYWQSRQGQAQRIPDVCAITLASFSLASAVPATRHNLRPTDSSKRRNDEDAEMLFSAGPLADSRPAGSH